MPFYKSSISQERIVKYSRIAYILEDCNRNQSETCKTFLFVGCAYVYPVCYSRKIYKIISLFGFCSNCYSMWLSFCMISSENFWISSGSWSLFTIDTDFLITTLGTENLRWFSKQEQNMSWGAREPPSRIFPPSGRNRALKGLSQVGEGAELPKLTGGSDGGEVREAGM